MAGKRALPPGYRIADRFTCHRAELSAAAVRPADGLAAAALLYVLSSVGNKLFSGIGCRRPHLRSRHCQRSGRHWRAASAKRKRQLQRYQGTSPIQDCHKPAFFPRRKSLEAACGYLCNRVHIGNPPYHSDGRAAWSPTSVREDQAFCAQAGRLRRTDMCSPVPASALQLGRTPRWRIQRPNIGNFVSVPSLFRHLALLARARFPHLANVADRTTSAGDPPRRRELQSATTSKLHVQARPASCLSRLAWSCRLNSGGSQAVERHCMTAITVLRSPPHDGPTTCELCR